MRVNNIPLMVVLTTLSAACYADEVVNISNWNGYIADDTLATFTRHRDQGHLRHSRQQRSANRSDDRQHRLRRGEPFEPFSVPVDQGRGHSKAR
jgi:hypothetical protein